MTTIQRVLFCAGVSSFYFDDQRAILAGARADGMLYRGRPRTPGFKAVREAGESLSILLLLDNGLCAAGDCAAVQYSGAGGRDPLFRAATMLPLAERLIRPLLEGRPVGSFRALAETCDALRDERGRPLHKALQYGLSQALLEACALAQRTTKCEVLCAEYGLPLRTEPIPVFGQSGDDRRRNVDKMILKRAAVIPHGLINAVEDKLGRDGGLLREYVRWIVSRLKTSGAEDYRPVLHFDVYGTLGLIFDHDPERIADYLATLQAEAGDLQLYIEGPVDMQAKAPQIDALRQLRAALARRGSPVKIVADEWCNTFEDVCDFCAAGACDMVQIKTPDLGGLQHTVASILHCHAQGMEAYQGGTCNETDLSARACVHVACAARPQRMLAKPGMGFDEGYTIVYNEMERLRRLLLWRLEMQADAPPRGGSTPL